MEKVSWTRRKGILKVTSASQGCEGNIFFNSENSNKLRRRRIPSVKKRWSSIIRQGWDKNLSAGGLLVHMLKKKGALGIQNKPRDAMQHHHSLAGRITRIWEQWASKQQKGELISYWTRSCTPKHLWLQHGAGSYLQSKWLVKTLITLKNICIH